MGKAEFNAKLGGISLQVFVDSEVEIHRLVGVLRKTLRFLEEDC
jgi:hypothetical protein